MKALTARTSAGDATAAKVAPAVQAVARGGEALPEELRVEMEWRFGQDLRDVRVHADGSANEAARALRARAYTSKAHIAFAAGEYQPSQARGRGLLAHELAHVLQARSASHEGHAPGLEAEAQQAAATVAAGRQPRIAAATKAPAVQCAGLLDYVPDVGSMVDGAAARALAALGSMSREAMGSVMETALASRILGDMLRSDPRIARYADVLDQLSGHDGAIAAVWGVLENPQAHVASLRRQLDPHIAAAQGLAKASGPELVRGLGVPPEHAETAVRVLNAAVSATGSVVGFVVEEVILDTILFWQLRSEWKTYEEVWKNYEAGQIDTFDLVVEHIGLVLSVAGRIADLIPLILGAAGILGLGAAGGAAGTVVPVAGNTAGAGVGAGTGAGASVVASEVLGLVITFGPAGLEVVKITKAVGDLALADQTDAQREQDYGQIASSVLSVVVMAALAILPGLAMRLGRKLGARIVSALPPLGELVPKVRRALGTGTPALPGPRPTTAATGTEVVAPPVSSPGMTAQTTRPADAEVPTDAALPFVAPLAPGVSPTAPAAVASPLPSGAANLAPERLDAPASAATSVAPAAPPPLPAGAVSAPPTALPGAIPFPAERVRPSRGSGGGAEVIRFPHKSKPRKPAPPEPEANAAREELAEALQKTGTDDAAAARQAHTPTHPAAHLSEAPRAMADAPDRPSGPPVSVPASSSGGSGTPRGGGGRGRGGGGGRGPTPPGPASPPRPARFHDNMTQDRIRAELGGRLNVADAVVEALPERVARVIAAHPRPLDTQPRALDIWLYLQYRELRWRPRRDSRRPPQPQSFGEWSRRFGPRRQQRVERLAERASPEWLSRQEDRLIDREVERELSQLEMPEGLRMPDERPYWMDSDQWGTADDPRAARRATEGSADLEDVMDDLQRVSELSDQDDVLLPKLAGIAMERFMRRTLPGEYGDALRQQPPADLRAAYRARGVVGPELHVIDEQRVRLVDITSRPNEPHLRKTQRDVDIAHTAQTGETPRRVSGQERYWEHTESPEDQLPADVLGELSQTPGAIDPETMRQDTIDWTLDSVAASPTLHPSPAAIDRQRALEAARVREASQQAARKPRRRKKRR